MGTGKSKLDKKKQNKSSSYMANAGGNTNRDNRKPNTKGGVFRKTRGYDEVQGEYKENRGRKKKK